MCGIIGIFGKNDAESRARLSLEKIVHRGSSTFELENFTDASLGANRLPIVDRALGKQPQANCDNTIYAAQNGEIFNYKKLQSELKELGHSFKTDSDTEVLAHLYEEYGKDMVHQLDSEMFAFVIYDKNNNSVFAARDPLGVKPLYYAHDTTGQLYFASEIKQLAFFDDIEKIHIFPSGSYYYDGEFRKYFDLEIDIVLTDEETALRKLEPMIVEAIRKRVQTDLPIGVFLSGGVDSSLIMEIASRLHPDVTAIILGYPGSSDYEFAMRLCKERGYKYHAVRPEVDYEKELDNNIYYSETYEPLIIRHSFSLDICAREAERLGLHVVLVGEGADELFGGYNEFSNLPDEVVNEGCKKLVESLHCGHLQRVDRMSMKHTVEVRAPFFDKDVVTTAMQIHGKLKVHRKNHQITTKYILRKVAADFLPAYIAWRYKVPFSNGAGMNVGNNFKAQDGDVAQIVLRKEEQFLPEDLLREYSITTKEEKYYLSKFREYNYTKLEESTERLVIKDTLNELHKTKETRLIVAEFDRLAIYFPTYFAAERGIFKLHNLDVDFIATGGDDQTYASLVNNSAHIGLSDPMFAMFENEEGIKGEIIGELVKNVPNVAVTINPNVKISDIDDFKNYKVGTFQEYTTTNGIARYLLPKETTILPFDYKDLTSKLVDRSVDVAIVLPEHAIDLVSYGGRIIYDFQKLAPQYLFSGFTVANILESRYKESLKSFLAAVREATRYILKNEKDAYDVFLKLFPHLRNPRDVFDYYLKNWSSTLKVDKEDYLNAYKMWNTNYPELLKEYKPYFRTPSPADPILKKINHGSYRRDYPFLEDVLDENIQCAIEKNEALQLISYWGASDKETIDHDEEETIAYLKKYINQIKDVFSPGINIQFILADEHARSNGYDQGHYSKYLNEIEQMLKEHGFETVYLSTLWKKWGLTEELLSEKMKNKKNGWWNDISIAKELEMQAEKRFKGDDKIFGAQHYYEMRVTEKDYLEEEYKGSIFFVYTDGRMQLILPQLPTLYLFTKGDGVSDVPWFNK